MKKQSVLSQFSDKNMVKQELGQHSLVDGLGLASRLSISPISYAELKFRNCSVVFVDDDFEKDEASVETHIYYTEDYENYEPINKIDNLMVKNMSTFVENATVIVYTNEEVVNYHIKEAITSTEERQQQIDEEVGILSPYHDEIGFRTDKDAEEYNKELDEVEGLKDFLSSVISDKLNQSSEKENKEKELKQQAEFGYANQKTPTNPVNEFMKQAANSNKESENSSTKTSYIQTETGYIVKDGVEEDTVFKKDNIVVTIGGYKEDGEVDSYQTSDIISDATIKDLEEECAKMNMLIGLAKNFSDDKEVTNELLRQGNIVDYYELENVKDKKTGEIIWIKHS